MASSVLPNVAFSVGVVWSGGDGRCDVILLSCGGVLLSSMRIQRYQRCVTRADVNGCRYRRADVSC